MEILGRCYGWHYYICCYAKDINKNHQKHLTMAWMMRCTRKCSSQRCITGISSMATGARRSAAIFDGPSSRKPALARLAARLPWPANPAGLSRWCETCSIGWVTLCTRKESCPGGQGGFSGTGWPGMAWHGMAVQHPGIGVPCVVYVRGPDLSRIRPTMLELLQTYIPT